MKRAFTLIVLLAILVAGATACGSSSKSSQAATPTTSASPAASGSAAQAASPSSGSCASAGTRKIPKTRLLADLGLTYGLFHRYLYNPYKAGTFHTGASGRTAAIIKAGLATAAIIKLLDNAVKNAAADPTLCKYVPTMTNIKSSLSGLTGKIKDGTATSSDVDGTSSLFDRLKNGTGFTPPANPSL